jgi:heat shock protein HslJ
MCIRDSNNEISFSPLAMTRMACIGNNTEQELMQAIETTKKVTYSVNELIFLDESGKELAIFEADFFK